MASHQTQQKLQQWGAWLRGGSMGLGYGVNALAKVRGGGVPLPAISDDEAMRIDRVMAILRRFNVEQYRCVKLAYVELQSNRAIGRAVGLQHMAVQRRIEAAEDWIGRQLGTYEKVVDRRGTHR